VNGKEVTVRNLRTLKLYEYSPVLWGMNQATGTLTAKDSAGKIPALQGKEEPGEEKPYGAVEEGEVWRVYKLDEDGEPTGEALGEHETEEEAQAQVRALYAAEKCGTENDETDERMKEMTPQGAVQRLGHVLQGSIHRLFTTLCDDWYVAGFLATDERIMLSGLIGDALNVLEAGIPEDIAMREPYSGMGQMPFMFMSLDLRGEEKAGRVLAARNAKRILEALEALTETLRDAGLMEVEEEEGNREDSKSAKKEIINEITAPDRAAEDDKKAGPGDDGHRAPPTDDELLRLIEIEEQEIQLVNLRD